jgi:hypothetical protein
MVCGGIIEYFSPFKGHHSLYTKTAHRLTEQRKEKKKNIEESRKDTTARN